MEDFLDAQFAAFGGQALILFPAIHDEEIVFPQAGLVMNHLGLGAHVLRVLQPVLQNPGEYLMPRQAPFEEVPEHWEKFSGCNYLGLQQHLQEAWDAAEQGEDMDNEEEDMDDEEATMDCTKTSSSEGVDAMSSASQHVTKRDDSNPDDCRLLKDIVASSSSVATIGLQDPSRPDASPAAFVAILEPVSAPVTTSEVHKLNI